MKKEIVGVLVAAPPAVLWVLIPYAPQTGQLVTALAIGCCAPVFTYFLARVVSAAKSWVSLQKRLEIEGWEEYDADIRLALWVMCVTPAFALYTLIVLAIITSAEQENAAKNAVQPHQSQASEIGDELGIRPHLEDCEVVNDAERRDGNQSDGQPDGERGGVGVDAP